MGLKTIFENLKHKIATQGFLENLRHTVETIKIDTIHNVKVVAEDTDFAVKVSSENLRHSLVAPSTLEDIRHSIVLAGDNIIHDLNVEILDLLY